MNIDDMQAGPDLDRLIAERVMRWKRRNADNERWWDDGGDRGRHIGGVEVYSGQDLISFMPSRRIEHAWEIVEKMRQAGITFDLDATAPQLGIDAAFHALDADRVVATAKTEAVAICRAALKAVA